MADDEVVTWTVDLEVSLFHAMRKHKPVGIPKHFQMTCIHDKLSSSAPRQITSKQIWKHLSSMYDLQALDNSEKVPFPNKVSEFSLPKDEFEELLADEFPRAAVSDLPISNTTPFESITKEVKERDRHSSGSSTRGGKAQAVEKQQKASLTDEKAEETPKRDARKRTRHSLQSPATDPTATHKRQRRI